MGFEVSPGVVVSVPESAGKVALARARAAAEELSARRARLLQNDWLPSEDFLVALASAWSAVAVAECAVSAAEPLVEVASPVDSADDGLIVPRRCIMFQPVSVGVRWCLNCGRGAAVHGREASSAGVEWWAVPAGTAADAGLLAWWVEATFGDEPVEILSRRSGLGVGVVDLEVRRGVEPEEESPIEDLGSWSVLPETFADPARWRAWCDERFPGVEMVRVQRIDDDVDGVPRVRMHGRRRRAG